MKNYQESSGETNNENKFSLVKRAKSFTHAGRGIWILVKTTHNMWLHILAAMAVIALGLFFSITQTEWLFIIFACGLVMVSEAFNTAIEIDIDLTSPEYHPYARNTKDVASGAVLISAITALIIGLFIFIPYIIIYL
jgi:diacylglycerol kinase